MRTLNLKGHLGQDAKFEIKSTENMNTLFAYMSVATRDGSKRKDKESGEYQDITNWTSIIYALKSKEVSKLENQKLYFEERLKKGSVVDIIGKPYINSYNGANGQTTVINCFVDSYNKNHSFDLRHTTAENLKQVETTTTNDNDIDPLNNEDLVY